MNFGVKFFLNSKLGLWFAENYEPKDNDVFIAESENINKVLRDRKLYSRETSSFEINRAFSIHWPRKFDALEISNFKYFLNIHPGYLPLGRGTYPIFWAVYLNEIAGATVHQITDKIDSGPILAREQVLFDEEMNAGELWNLVYEVEKRMLMRCVSELKSKETIDFPTLQLGKTGPNRKRSEFEFLRDSPDLRNMSPNQIKRLKLALTHQNFPFPMWMQRMS